MISVRPVFLMMLGLASFLSTVSAAGEGTARQRLDFNAGWSFHKGDPEGLGDQLAYSKIKDRLLASANAFARTPAPVPKEDFVTTADYAQPGFDDSAWRKLDLPHDWGIEGPFKQEYPGETGKLPWWGVAWYRKSFDLPAGGAAATDERVYLDVDGAMSYATVWCNGRLAGPTATAPSAWISRPSSAPARATPSPSGSTTRPIPRAGIPAAASTARSGW